MASEEMRIGKSRHQLLTRWWLRSRSCKHAIQLPDKTAVVDGIRINYFQFQPCVEFYVPIWAWPFELLHRIVFGSVKLHATSRDKSK
jgi:hypothetical protein